MRCCHGARHILPNALFMLWILCFMHRATILLTKERAMQNTRFVFNERIPFKISVIIIINWINDDDDDDDYSGSCGTQAALFWKKENT